MTDRPRALTRLVFVTALVAALLASLAPPAAAQPGNKAERGKPPAEANWHSCYGKLQEEVWPDEFAEFFGGPVRFECTTVQVPLDYDGPDGGTIQIGLVRIPARNQADRIGSLFTNPGGPGGSGIEFTLFSGPAAFGGEIRDRFDIVGFDPRGILLSTAARCFGNVRQAQNAASTQPPPATPDEVSTWLEADAELRAECAQRGRRILDHMSTANVARDLDRLRQAVGDDQLNYVGFSYGSMVGSTYANLFPDNVRAMALDSALDPVAWTTDDGSGLPFSSRLGSHTGAQDSLDEFFRLCDSAGPALCPIAPDSAARFAAVVDALRAEPLVQEFEVVDPRTGEVTIERFEYRVSFLIAEVLGILYADPAWPIISFIVADLEAQLFGAPPPGFARTFAADIEALRLGQPNTFTTRAGLDYNRTPRYFNFLEGFPGVACLDSDNPSSIGSWESAAAQLDQTSYFGSFWTWLSSICVDWPFSDEDRYAGPWNAVTPNPVLVINNEFDPATPLEGAVALDGLLGNSQLLVVEGGRGHIAVQTSTCVALALEAYLVDLALPGPVCFPDLDSPFLLPPPPPLLALIEPLDGVGDPIEVILFPGPTPDVPPIAVDPVTGEPINIDPESGEVLPVVIVEIIGPWEPPQPPEGEPPPPGEPAP